MLLSIPQESIENAQEYNSGQFPVPRSGVGVSFEIKDVKTRENERDGEVWEDLIVEMVTEDDDGEEIVWGDYFFRPDRDFGLAKLKTFVQYLGLDLTPEFDTDDLLGIRFSGDVSHKPDKNDPAITRANIDYKSITLEDVEESKPKPRKPARGGSRR